MTVGGMGFIPERLLMMMMMMMKEAVKGPVKWQVTGEGVFLSVFPSQCPLNSSGFTHFPSTLLCFMILIVFFAKHLGN